MPKKNKIYYLGPKGSYTQQATKKFFGNQKIDELPNIYSILNKIFQEKESLGIVPVENSTAGSLNIVLDGVVENDLKIIGEEYLPISHCLLSTETNLKDIKKIYAHPQSIAQSKDWLRNNLPSAELKEVASNSTAAIITTNQKNSAAIASEYCAKIYKLKILAKQLEENPSNYTRFWIIGNKISKSKINNKVSLFVILNDKVAALRDLLNIFAKHKLNLSKIESRALKGQAWQYGFFIDFFGNIQNSNIIKTLKDIEQEVAEIKILGNYKNKQDPNKTTEYLINYLQKLFKQNNKLIKNNQLNFNSDILTQLLQTRLLLIPSVALYKYSNNIPQNKIYQPKREQEIIKKREVQIKKKNINADILLIKLANQNMSISCDLQKDIYQDLANKKTQPELIKKIDLSKLRGFLDQIDQIFDEVLAEYPAKEQRKKLEKIIN